MIHLLHKVLAQVDRAQVGEFLQPAHLLDAILLDKPEPAAVSLHDHCQKQLHSQLPERVLAWFQVLNPLQSIRLEPDAFGGGKLFQVLDLHVSFEV